jgi:hypothetical protein
VQEALSALSDAGISIRVTTSAQPATLASAPWVAPWPAAGQTAPGEDYLLDLACARECAQADAVGFAAGDYEFTQRLTGPALARRELFLPGSPAPDSWGTRGLRLITLKGVH